MEVSYPMKAKKYPNVTHQDIPQGEHRDADSLLPKKDSVPSSSTGLVKV